MNEIKIGLSKKKIIFAFIGSAIFVALGILFILNPEKFVSAVFRNVYFIRIAGFACIIFFSLCLIYISFKFFDKKPGLLINQNGITDNLNFSSIGLIKWSEIIAIRSQQVMSTKFILIDVSNPAAFIPTNSKFKASLMKANLRMYGTPLSITSNSLDYNFDDLEKLLHTEFNKYKTTPNS